MKKYRHTARRQSAYIILVGFAALLGRTSTANATAPLGTLGATVGVDGSTVTNGSVWLSGNASGYYGSASYSGSAFSLTVQGGQTYNYLSVNEYTSDGSRVSIMTNAPMTVPQGGTTTLNLVRPGGILQGHLSVTGGTFAYWYLSASSSTNMPGGVTESYAGFKSAYGSSDLAVAMVAGDSIQITGNAQINVVDPLTGNVLCTKSMALPTQTVALGDGGSATVSETLTVSPDTCGEPISGTLALDNLPGGLTTSYWTVGVNGGDGEGTGLRVNGGNIVEYATTRLPQGQYMVNADAYFNTSQFSAYLDLPLNNPFFVNVGSSPVTRDFIFDGAIATGGAVLTGPWSTRASSLQTSSSGVCDYSQPNGGTSCTGSSFSSTSDSYTHTQVLTSGNWINDTDKFSFSDSTTASGSVVSIHYDNPALLSASAGATLTIPPRQIDTSEGQVIFDVVEPPGSPVVIVGYPRVYAQSYDSAARRRINISAYAVQYADTPIVRLLGPSGIYSFDAYAYIRGANTKLGSSKIELGKAVDTPPGAGVTAQLRDSSGGALPATLTFADITTGGGTAASLTDFGPGVPIDYIRLNAIQGKPFLGIATTATFSNGVDLAINYDPVALGLTPLQEENLKLLQYVCTSLSSCSWQIINKPSSGTSFNPDLTTHTLYGSTTSLSTFAVMVPKVILAPTDTCMGSGTGPAQLNTAPGVCSVTVDNTNRLAGGCSGGGGGLASCTFDGSTSETLALGAHDLSIVGTADDFSISICTSYVNVVDREPPAISCPPPATVECAGVTTPYSVLASCTDNCQSCGASCGPDSFPLGTTVSACNAVDTAGNKSSCTATVTVQDTLPPSLSLTASPTTLWPPNKRLIPIALDTVATDVCDPSPKVTCSVTSNEPASGDGSGHVIGVPDGALPAGLMTGMPSQDPAPYDPSALMAAWVTPQPTPDTGNWKATDDIVWQAGELFLRADRLGSGTGRVYTITCVATDASGNSTTRSTTVTVPHDQGQ